MISAGVPSATISPPWTPAPGPMSTTWSAARIASSSCSTTITVLPRSRRRLQRVEQARVVALVQADRGLVEHVEHAGQARADLRGEPDALALAARQRARARATASDSRARRRLRKRQPVADLLEDALGDLVALGVERVGQVARTSRPPRLIDSVETSPMCLPSILTASASGFRREPLAGRAGRRGHDSAPAPRATQSLSVSRQRRSRLRITPSNGFFTS